MGLVQVATNTVSSAISSLTLTGIDSDDVYMVVVSNVQPVTDNKNLTFRITKSGSADITANYNHAAKLFKANTTFSDTTGTSATSSTFAFSLGNNTGEKANAILYLYNFADASEYSFITVESNFLDLTPNLIGFQGGIVHTDASASDGVSFEMEGGVNFNTGATFTLYRVV